MIKKYVKEILVSEKGLSDMNFEGIKKVLTYIKNNFIDPDSNMYSLVGLILLKDIFILNPMDMIKCI